MDASLTVESQAVDEGGYSSQSGHQWSQEESSGSANRSLGLDQRIDNAFRPVSDAFVNFVFWSIPQFGPIPSVPLVLVVLVSGAAYFTVYFGFANVRLFPLSIRVVRGKYRISEEAGAPEIKHVEVHEVDGDLVDTIRDEHLHGEVSHFQALATAVSGTVGLGNIGGVAVAIAIGGPGATFWMIVCGLLGMSTKFVECTLGVKYRDIEPDGTVHGGPTYYLSRGFAQMGLAPLGKLLGGLFAVLCVGASFGGGNMFQANQATAQIQTLIGIQATQSEWAKSSGALIGLVMAIFVGFIIIGGIKRIANVTDKVVPLMTALYVVACIIIVVIHIEHLPEAIRTIMVSAFTHEAGMGGVVGVILVGFKRAVFSNEAGAGSASIAHSAVRTRYPASEGIVALMEPFLDTVVICTMTALVIILYNMNGAFEYSSVVNGQVLMLETGHRVGGVDLTSLAFDSALPNFRYVLTVAVVLFAISTMISWSYYGLTSWKALFGRSRWSDLSFKILFCAFIVVGSASSLQAVIDFSDAMILALVFPNMLGLILLAPKVREELNRFLEAIKERRSPN
ncbi:MAG: alanine:cation symporter family protein [Pirellulaceae bacterium]|nr:alanine:cation symporter family protein [Pirellulaceae bacterium]